MPDKNEKRLKNVERRIQDQPQKQSSLKEDRIPDEQNRLKDQKNRRA